MTSEKIQILCLDFCKQKNLKGEKLYEWRKMLQLCALGTQKMRDDRTNQE